ncbi:MAG: ATP-grasp domain-containing protein, partial [Burkholderiales bacterium]|nr:ATP-grasp domain-containing protein [Burkholderiales bacterium]
KPDDGAGALATRLHPSRAAALADAAGRGGDPRASVVEPWVDGEALSLSLLGRRGALELLSVNRQRLSFGGAGAIGFDGVDLDVMPASDPRRERLRRLAEAVAGCVPGLRGFVGIDLVWHPERGPVVIEINPRLTSAYVGLARALGRPLAAEILDACTDCGRA